MKPRKMSGSKTEEYAVLFNENAAHSKSYTKRDGDTVNLSSYASAAITRAQEEGHRVSVTKEGFDRKPLPDPRTTAQAILDKELHVLFGSILSDRKD
ncbi:MAG: hypothetical protein GY847_41405 [Proteobacteria bacterium]|nr:hypothetical protein [Pseudomonadota bacterium]